MTDREKAIVTAYTGACMLSGDGFQIFHEYIEDIMGRPVYMHELANKAIEGEIKEKAKADFIALCAEQEPKINPEGNVVYGRGGNLYELTLSNGKEYEQEPMRGATPEELKSVNDYIKSISKPTGVKFDFDEEQEQIDFVQPHKTVGKLISVDVLDKIRAELIQSIQNGTLKIESGNEELFRIIDKYRAESEE